MEENRNDNRPEEEAATGGNPQPSSEYSWRNEQYSRPAEPPKKKKKKGLVWKIIGIVLLVAIIGSLAYVGGRTLYEKYVPAIQDNGLLGAFGKKDSGGTPDKAMPEISGEKQEEKPAAELPAETEKPVEKKAEKPASTGEELSAADIYADNVDSIVAITTSGETVNYWGYQIPTGAKGSGFIISEDGYILTNYHVIADSSTIEIATYSGDTYKADVVGFDASNDIAILKVEADGLQPVTIGDSDDVRVGEVVYAIGNPLGDLTFSMTSGIVSALNRPVQLSSTQSMNLIQTDCAINSGNSGGALFNSRGEVIGITNAKYSSSGSSGEASIDNIGFAIPINTVWNIVKSVLENGYVVKPYIGIYGYDLDDQVKMATGIKCGVMVAEVVEGEAAEKAGIQANDIITNVDGKDIESFSTLSTIVSSHAPGDVLTVKVYRQGQTFSTTLTVGAQKQTDVAQSGSAEAEQDDMQNQYGAPQQGQGQDQYGQDQQGQGYSEDDYNSMLEEFMKMFGYSNY